ncbi:MAG TPA: hypothetical protein VNE67_13525 [Acetobacteraceae bacterium]|nr:hypothetical protein [Acetobacteraceae bacterium]
MAWKLSGIPEITPHDLIHACLSDGCREIEVLGTVRIAGRTARILALHVQGAGPGSLGISGLRGLAGWAMEVLDVDELRIEGAARTSGAGPGRTPGTLVFRRPGHSAAAAGRVLR